MAGTLPWSRRGCQATSSVFPFRGRPCLTGKTTVSSGAGNPPGEPDAQAWHGRPYLAQQSSSSSKKSQLPRLTSSRKSANRWNATGRTLTCFHSCLMPRTIHYQSYPCQTPIVTCSNFFLTAYRGCGTLTCVIAGCPASSPVQGRKGIEELLRRAEEAQLLEVKR